MEKDEKPTDFRVLDFKIVSFRGTSNDRVAVKMMMRINSEGNTEDEVVEGNWPNYRMLEGWWKKIKNNSKKAKNNPDFWVDHWVFYSKVIHNADDVRAASVRLTGEKTMSNEKELRFASENEALQLLADLEGRTIVIASYGEDLRNILMKALKEKLNDERKGEAVEAAVDELDEEVKELLDEIAEEMKGQEDEEGAPDEDVR